MKEKYLNYITYSRQYSDKTIKGYTYILNKIDEYLVTIGKSISKPEELKVVDIYNFLGYLSQEWLSPCTCAWIMDGVKAYLRWCKNVGELDILDLSKIKSPKVPDREIWFFSEEEKSEILDAVNRGVGARKITQLRNKLLTYMLLHTGLRCHELAKIKVSEIWESLQVIGKWWVRRFVFLRPEILNLIYSYLWARERDSEYLFDGTKGHITTDRIKHIFQKMSKLMWFHIHAHKFRHTFATDLLHIPWANIYSVSRLLGHKRITTTQIYLGTDNSELKKLQFWLRF